VFVGVRVLVGVRVSARAADCAIGGNSSPTPIARPTPKIISQPIIRFMLQPYP